MSDYITNPKTGKIWVPKEPNCPKAPYQPVRIIETANNRINRIPIKQYPSGLSETIGWIKAAAKVKVRDYYIPDPEGFGSDNKKWYPLDDNSGFVNRAHLFPFPERTVQSISYVDDQRYIKFTNDTCLKIPPAPQTYTVPSTGRWKQVVHDWQNPDHDYKPRTHSEVPETVMMWSKPDFYPLDTLWQHAWFDLIRYHTHSTMTDGQLLTAWAEITAERKALTDNHGLSHGFADFILGIFTEGDKVMAQKGLVFGGTMVRMRRYGSTIYAIDPALDAPTLPWLLDNPWAWGWATVITSDATSIKWPQLKRFGDWGVPYFIIGHGGKNVLRPEHLIPLSNGQIYSPYTHQ